MILETPQKHKILLKDQRHLFAGLNCELLKMTSL